MSGKRLSDIALNYTILGNYKNVYVTGKSAYFAKKKKKKNEKKCKCTNIYQRDRFLKENYDSAGCTQFSLRVLRAVARTVFGVLLAF